MDHKVETLLNEMTLEEKLGQLTQSRGGRSKDLNSLVDDEQKALVRQGRIGSYLHVAGAEFLTELQRVAVKESRLGIPLLFGLDVVHGYRTIFPVPLAAACSWDPDVVERAARLAAEEATAAGINWTFAPMVDVARDPRWGRIVEGAGEDPYLGAVMAAAQVRGYQGERLSDPNSLLACAKHFVAYGAALGGRDYDSADVPPRTLAEVYLPPFRAAVEAGAGSVMTGFNDLAGIPMTAHQSLLQEVLRDRWGFAGLVVSDWNAIDELRAHGVAESRAAAGAMALSAGVDMDMVSGIYQHELGRLVESGQLPSAVVDAAVRRVLRIKHLLGLFEDPFRYGNTAREQQVILSQDHVAFAREIAGKSIVLLKNDGDLLPLDRNLKKLALIGPLADDRKAPLGSWKALGQPDDVVSVRAGILAAVGPDTEVQTVAGCDTEGDSTAGLAEAERLARSADAVVLVLGEHDEMSGEARSRSSLELPGVQRQLAERVLAVKKPTVVVLMGGRPLAIPWLAEQAPALLETWLLGVQMGSAVADVLFGEVNPGGKLVATFPVSVGQVPFFYGHRNTGRPASTDPSKDSARYIDAPITPLFPFGHGLSYTTFEYTDIDVTPAEVGAGDIVQVRCTVTNRGQRAGDEVVQLYARDPVASVAQPVQELVGFHRIRLEPGSAATLTFSLPVEMLGYYDAEMSYRVEPGEFRIAVGASAADIRLDGSFRLREEIRDRGEPGSVFSRVDVAKAAAGPPPVDPDATPQP